MALASVRVAQSDSHGSPVKQQVDRPRYPHRVTSRDTHPQARQAQLEALRRLGAAGRVARALEMSEQARRIAVQGWLDRHPEASAEQARAQVLRRALGDELFEAAYRRKPR